MKITTVILSLCEAARAKSLQRAIASVPSASAFPVEALVVVNGKRYHNGLLASLRAMTDTRTVEISEASLVY